MHLDTSTQTGDPTFIQTYISRKVFNVKLVQFSCQHRINIGSPIYLQHQSFDEMKS